MTITVLLMSILTGQNHTVVAEYDTPQLAQPQHKHTRKSFWGTKSERSIAVLLKRAHANERSTDTCAATDAAASARAVMSALGQKQTFAVQKHMSALPPIADIERLSRNVR